MGEKEVNAYAKGFKEGWDKLIESFKNLFDLSFSTSLNYPEHLYIKDKDFQRLREYLEGLEEEPKKKKVRKVGGQRK